MAGEVKLIHTIADRLDISSSTSGCARFTRR